MTVYLTYSGYRSGQVMGQVPVISSATHCFVQVLHALVYRFVTLKNDTWIVIWPLTHFCGSHTAQIYQSSRMISAEHCRDKYKEYTQVKDNL